MTKKWWDLWAIGLSQTINSQKKRAVYEFVMIFCQSKALKGKTALQDIYSEIPNESLRQPDIVLKRNDS